MPYVIAINSISGGGKASLAKLLHKSPTRFSRLFCTDEFDETQYLSEGFLTSGGRMGAISWNSIARAWATRLNKRLNKAR